jgi:glycosyltransferase involved in cell wall biosynthesis
MPTALIWNAHWMTLGGGEKYALELGASLRLNGFKIFFAGTCDFPKSGFFDTFNLEILEDEYLKVSGESEVEKLASAADLFINASFGSRLSAPHMNSVYVCHFPFASKLHRFSNKYLRMQGVLRSRDKRIYGNPSKAIMVESDSILRFGKNTRIMAIAPEGSWKLFREGQEVNSLELNSPIDLKPGLFFLEKQIPSRASIVIQGFREPSLRSLFLDYWSRRYSFVDTYRQVWVHTSFVAEWTKKIWNREPYVVYPPVSLSPPTYAVRNPTSIVSVGRFMAKRAGHSKNQIEMIKAFSKLTEKSSLPWELHLVGGVSPEQQRYFDKVKRASKNLNVKLHPNLTHTELQKLYSTSSYYWHAAGLNQPRSRPERFEHFGITVVEAMSFGLIPLVFNVGGPSEILRDYPDLLFGSLDKLVQNTLKVNEKEQESLRREMETLSLKFETNIFYINSIEHIFKLRDLKKSTNGN